MARKMSNTTQSRQSSFRKGNKTLKKSSFLKRKNKKTLNSKKKTLKVTEKVDYQKERD